MICTITTTGNGREIDTFSGYPYVEIHITITPEPYYHPENYNEYYVPPKYVIEVIEEKTHERELWRSLPNRIRK